MRNEPLRIVDATADQVGRLPCCGIMNTGHEGHRAKRAWLKAHIPLGLRARLLLDEGGHQVGYIEYLPGQHAWRGVDAAGYLFIHCLWIHYTRHQGQGRAARLVKACVKEARDSGLRGVAVVARNKAWLASSEIFLECGFQLAATAPPDYSLLVKKFGKGDPDPAFLPADCNWLEGHRGLTLVYAHQCPYAVKFAREIAEHARSEFGLKARRVVLRDCHAAQHAPTPYSIFTIVLDGKVIADHQVSRRRFHNIMKQEMRVAGAWRAERGRTRR